MTPEETQRIEHLYALWRRTTHLEHNAENAVQWVEFLMRQFCGICYRPMDDLWQWSEEQQDWPSWTWRQEDVTWDDRAMCGAHAGERWHWDTDLPCACKEEGRV